MAWERGKVASPCLLAMLSHGAPGVVDRKLSVQIRGRSPLQPGRYAPMVSDMANTGVARGKIYLARNRGERLASHRPTQIASP